MRIKSILKIMAALLALVTLGTVAVSCGALRAEEMIDSVKLPETYSITYEVKNKDGEITTVSKTRDENGNVYFRSGDTELLFIKDGNAFVEYTKNAEGELVCDSNKKVDGDYVDNATVEFLEYAEQSRNRFMPTAKESGTQTIANRPADRYTVKVGISAFNVSYNYYVDTETGVCLGYDTQMVLAGISVDTDDTVFTCTEFITDGIEILYV